MSRKIFCGAVAALGCMAQAAAAVIDLFPGQSFEQAAENLNPGDTLVVHAGTYTHSNRIAITVQGTATEPVVIMGAPGEARPVIQLVQAGNNTMEIAGATHLAIKGLEITAPGMPGADGINMNGGPSHITIEDNVIHDIAVGINYRSSMHHIVARRNEIYDTSDTGEGFYVGCHNGSCSVTDSIIEQNYVHHTLNADQGDGIEIKLNSHSNIVRDNVVHDTNFPCILLYGTGGGGQNVVERNVMWNCGDSGIQVAADTVLRNNIVMASSAGGLTSQPHNGVTPNNLQFYNNTFIGGSTCLRMQEWGNKTSMIFANNAVYCAGANFAIGSVAGVTFSGNVFEEAPPVIPPSGYAVGRSKAQDFVDHANRDAYPSADSPLLGAGDVAHVPVDDFNGTQRSGAIDAGAYHWTGAGNPGWAVTAGFKDAAPIPVVTLTADDAQVVPQGATTLRWSTSQADSCTAVDGWAGPKAPTGAESVGPLTADTTFTLNCSNNAGGQAGASVTVTVAAPLPPQEEPPPEAPPPEEDPDESPPTDDPTAEVSAGEGSSGSALGMVGLGVLLLVAARRRR
jgi:MYXO-CTERM domain-containing protein